MCVKCIVIAGLCCSYICHRVQVLSLSFLAVKYSDLECGDKLGEGGLGTVYQGLWIPKNVAVAIKVVAIQLDPGKVG